jgi:hypothetical protein
MSTYAASIEDDRPGWVEQVMCFAVVPVRLWSHLGIGRWRDASLSRCNAIFFQILD